MDHIREAYEEHKGIYGYRRLTIYLNHYKQCRVNHKCMYRLMTFLGLKAVIRRKKYTYKRHNPTHTAQNVLNRDFQADQPMRKLVTDITEFKLSTGKKAYLSAVLDLGTNQISAYQLGYANNNPLVLNTFDQIKDHVQANQTLIHSDRGFQYTSHAFRQFIENHQLIQSMSRVGKCIDNGPMENFWGILKSEMFERKTYDTFDELKADIDRYITFYNTKRVTLDMGLAIPA